MSVERHRVSPGFRERTTADKEARMSGTLALHCGAGEVTREDVRSVGAPEGTESWTPIPHGLVLDNTIEALEGVGLNVRHERYGLTQEARRFFGVLDLASPVAEGVSLAVGLRNSTDKSMSAGLVLGQRVFVCDNLAFDAEIKVTRRHTPRIAHDLPGMIEMAVSRIQGYREIAEQRIERMRGYALTDRVCHDIVVRAADRACINWTDIPRVLGEWREPSHEAFADRTAWSLYNGFTEVLKKTFRRAPEKATGRTIRLAKLFEAAMN